MNLTYEDVAGPKNLFFHWPDYTVFSLMLAVSATIGIFFGCFGTRQKTASEYLLGGKTMKVFPVAVSLVASEVSAITLLGVPSEVYTYGTQYWLVCLAAVFVGIIVCFVYLPVFHKLQLTSSFEYLQLRFNYRVRFIASFLYTLSLILYIPIVVYIPAMAFSQVSGINIHTITPLVSTVCIFYTTLGGLKAVVWTDFLQQTVMLAATIVIIVLGIAHVGGLSTMWNINLEGGRIEFFNMNPSPLARLTFWTVTIGTTFNWLSNCGISQSTVQRFLAVPTLRGAQWTMIILMIGIILCKSLSCLTGLIIYAKYHDCDPQTIKVINKQDQLLPYFVMDIAGNIPGLPGLFLAGVFSAALSTMSTSLNTVSGIIYEDFVAMYFPKRWSDAQAGFIMKLTVLVLGIMCILLVFLVENLSGVLQLSGTFAAILGVQFGLFTLGMLCPWANSKGALVGGLVSVGLVTTIVVGSQIAIYSGSLKYLQKSMSVEGCLHLADNETTHIANATMMAEPFVLFKVSYIYINAIGCLTVLVVGIAVSILTGVRDPCDVDRDLLSPVLYRWLPKHRRTRTRSRSRRLKHGSKKTSQPLFDFRRPVSRGRRPCR